MKLHLVLFLTIILSEGKNVLDWLSRHLLACPIKSATGADCPGCGLQRSVIALLRGDMVHSLKLYPATLPIIFLFVYTLLHLKFDFKHGALVIKVSYITATIVILINYIYKVYHHQLF